MDYLQLAECGLLTTYSVQLQGTTVDFSVQMKYQFLLLQFVKSLQVLICTWISIVLRQVTRHVYATLFCVMCIEYNVALQYIT
jgi:hypothetical protein